MTDLAVLRRRRDRLATGTPTSTPTRSTSGTCACTGASRAVRARLYARRPLHTTTVNCTRCGRVTTELWALGNLRAQRSVRVDPGELRAHLAQDASSRSSSTRNANVFNSRNHVAGCDCSAACRADRVRITYDGKPAA